MRIHINKRDDGVHEVVVVPFRSAHLAPIMVRGPHKATVFENVAEVIKQVAALEKRHVHEVGPE